MELLEAVKGFGEAAKAYSAKNHKSE
jgi:hypothetical protein